MSTNITVNGTVYSVPSAGETGWASSVSTYLIAVGSAFLSKSGGSFTLTANANFGATYGLISKYFTSYSSNPSTTGVIRLANNEGIGFRNAANGADLILKVNASNVLEYNGNPITALALGTADYVLRMNAGGTATEYAKLVDANIASGAAIAVNKLAALTASKAAATDASGFVSAATTSLTELNYLSGVTAPTGTGALVLANSPTLITPTVGDATATSINKVAITAPATSATLTLADGKTLTISNTLTFTGTDSSSVAFGTGGTVAYTANKLSAFAATTSAELAGVISDETGSGLLVFATSPSLTTPSLGAATATSINSTTIPSSKTLVVTTDKLSVHAATTSAELAGVISDETGSGALVFGTSPNITTPTGIVKGDVGLGNVDNTSDATKNAATATLTNKTLTSPILNSPTINTPTVDVMTIDGQASAPSNPASGYYKTYVSDSDGKLHVRDSSGNDSAVGSGSSGRNYLSEWFDSAKSVGTITNSLGDVIDTSDRTGNETTWGSDGTDDITFSDTTTEALSPLREGKSYVLKHVSTGTGFIESPLFSLDAVDLGKPVTFSFDVSGVTTSDDWQVYVVRYDTNDVLKERIVVAGTASATSPYSARLPTGTSTFNGFFIAGSTSTDQYAIRFARNSASDTANIIIDSLKVSPEQVIQGAVVTDWVGFTATGLGALAPSVTSQSFAYRRVGQNMEIKGWVKISSGLTSGSITMTLPGGCTIDTTYADTAFNVSHFGNVNYLDSGVGYGVGAVGYNSTTSIALFSNTTSGGLSSTMWNASVPITWAANDEISFTALIPISGWSSSVTMANREVEEYAYNSSTNDGNDYTSFAYGLEGKTFVALTASASKRVRFKTVVQPTDQITLEVWDDISSMWYPHTANRNGSYAYNVQGTTNYGMWFTGVNSTDIDVTFATYANSTGASYGSAGSAWGGHTSKKWRVRKVSGGASVGYPVSARNIVGDITGTAVPSGYIGEVVEGTAMAGTGGNAYGTSISSSSSWTASTRYTLFTKTLNKGSYLLVVNHSAVGWNSGNSYDLGLKIGGTAVMPSYYYSSPNVTGGCADISLTLPINITADSTIVIVDGRVTGSGGPFTITTYGYASIIRIA